MSDIPVCKCGKMPSIKWDSPSFGAKSKSRCRILCDCGKGTSWHGGNRDLSRVRRAALKDWKDILRVAPA